jgi:hypothetical protein
MANITEQIHSVAHDWIQILRDEHFFSESDAEDLAYEALAQALLDDRFKKLQFLIRKLPDTVKVEKGDLLPEYEIEILRDLVKKIALRMLNENQQDKDRPDDKTESGKKES